MGATVTASNGAQLPIDSLSVNVVYSGSFVSTMTTQYSGTTYVQTFTNDGTHITAWTNWVAQVPVVTYMQTESGGYTMITEDNNLMITEGSAA